MVVIKLNVSLSYVSALLPQSANIKIQEKNISFSKILKTKFNGIMHKRCRRGVIWLVTPKDSVSKLNSWNYAICLHNWLWEWRVNLFWGQEIVRVLKCWLKRFLNWTKSNKFKDIALKDNCFQSTCYRALISTKHP